MGNRIYETVNGVQTQYTIDDNDRLSQQGGTSYQYDDNGNTINETLDGITTSYTYDSRNRLIATDKGGAQIDMAYDPDGIRVQKVVDGEVTDYLVDSNRAYAQVLYERTGSGELGYTFGTDLVGLDTGSESYSYQTDALGSTRLLSDGNGAIADTPAFDAWGVQLGGGDVAENQYLFTGEQFDVSLGLQYLRARYMDTGGGRFTQMDTWMGIPCRPLSHNKYLYGEADPLNKLDPTGKFSMVSVGVAAIGVGIVGSQAVQWKGSFLYSSPRDTSSCTGGETRTQIRNVGVTGAIWGGIYAAQALLLAEYVAAIGDLTGSGYQDDVDAFRHCYWSCLMTQKIGKSNAKIIGDSHESCAPGSPSDNAMDYFNNQKGRNFAALGNCYGDCLLGAQTGILQLSP